MELVTRLHYHYIFTIKKSKSQRIVTTVFHIVLKLLQAGSGGHGSRYQHESWCSLW